MTYEYCIKTMPSTSGYIYSLYYFIMKLEDVLCLNPEEELYLFGRDYEPVNSSDSDENTDTTKDTTDVLLIPTELKDNYKVEAEA